MNTKYIYYGWVSPQDAKYSVNRYPIIQEQDITGIKSYVVDNYLVVGQHHSTRYIEEHYLNSEIKLNYERVGLMSLNHAKALNWVKEQKLKLESKLLDDLQKIQEAKIEDCGEAVYI